MRMPGYPPGVPSPLTRHHHPYPTRFHGTNYIRPVFSFPYVQTPLTVNMPGEIAGLGSDYEVGQGIFRPGGYGGGVFDGNLAGLGDTLSTQTKLYQECVAQSCQDLSVDQTTTCHTACLEKAKVLAQQQASPVATYVPSAPAATLPSPEASAQSSMLGGDNKWLMFAVGGAVAVGALIYLKKKGKLG